MRPGYDERPVNPLPRVVWLIVLPLAAMEAWINAGILGLAGGRSGIGWRNAMAQDWALEPQMLDQMLQGGGFNADFAMRFLTYPLVHGSFTHALLAMVFILALGKFVGEVFRGWAVLAVFLAATVAGGVVYSLVPGLTTWLFGAYPGAYGLIGAFTFILWARLGAEHANRARAFTLIAFLLGIQLVFGALFGGKPDWVADLAGFAAGFGLSFLVVPGGFAHLMRVIRQR
ncbi:rhomboid family intramembrane serine protease [Defluviimonas sp. WL0050]|uniref:Rhomboid family intramembrane serine protease n=1 Tax=Albidovulum litorale TaxID=2984134 RepID=A0ABT2ZM48_9RHOB|nr:MULTISPECIES: rhomboid family intramembrane serine protease [Defluviimonas]MCV2871801.1 rhomboid family intramembrane serine protease [Defluviimonas sp. WL0050]MDI3336891.1 rhomboid family intramembrane serine protease [Defluviimonas aestuarii]